MEQQWIIVESYDTKNNNSCKYNKDKCRCPGHPEYRSVSDVRNDTNETIYGECIKELCPLRSDNFE